MIDVKQKKRENEVMKELKANMNTQKSYISEEELKEYHKEYNQINKEKHKKYYEDNKEKIK